MDTSMNNVMVDYVELLLKTYAHVLAALIIALGLSSER